MLLPDIPGFISRA